MSICGAASTIRLGDAEVGRFIIGHNPPCGNSHFSDGMNQDMKAYFTAGNVVALYQCAEQGVKTLMIRGDFRMLDWVEQYRRAGGRMNVLGQTASEMHDIHQNIRIMAAAGVKGVYHHGSQTDNFWREGRIKDCLPYLATIRKTGMAVGLGTHDPAVIEYAEEHHWDVDFYMACVYNLSRRKRESAIVSGKTVGYSSEVYLTDDRDRMLALIRQVRKPVLAFKILAAARLCKTQEDVRDAFQYTLARIKNTDGVVVGVFPKYVDQVALDVGYFDSACRAGA